MSRIFEFFILIIVATCCVHAARLPKQYYVLHNIFQIDPSQQQIPAGYIQSPFHYFTPLYDYGFQLRPLYPSLQPGFVPQGPPQLPPQLPPQTPTPDDDGIEKLDQKYDPAISSIHNTGSVNNDDDSVTIEALY